MVKNSKRLDKKVAIIGTIAMFFLLLNASTIYSYYYTKMSNIFLILGGVMTIFLVFIAQRFLVKRTLGLSLIYLSTFLIVGVFTGFNSSVINYFLKYSLIFIICSVFFNYKIKILKQLYIICSVFVVWGFINYLFFTILDLSNLFPVTASYQTYWGGYYNLLGFIFLKNYMGQTTIAGITVTRLHIPFSEPGVAQLAINFAIFYFLFLKEERKSIKHFVWFIFLLGNILLTVSLTGYAITAALLFIYLFKKKRYVVLFLFIALAVMLLSQTIAEKLTSQSYVDRMDDFAFVFKSAYENMPFGIGLSNSDVLGSRINEQTGLEWRNSFFCGLFTPLLYLGLFSIPFYVLLFYSVKYADAKKNTFASIALFVLLSVTLLTEPLSFTTFIAVFLANGILNRSARLHSYQVDNKKVAITRRVSAS